MSKKENDRACTSCCSSTPSGVVPTDLNLNIPLVAQCQSPRDHPPRCKPQPGQILLAIECGTFFYWGKVLVDQDEDGDIDSSHYEWLPVKCGGCAPVSFRQSQIYFYDCFTGVETVTGPIVDTDCDPAPPKSGDYLIDCATHNVWLYAQDPTTGTCSWLLKENCFGSSLITISKTASAAVYNCTTKKFEINYSVTICNIGDRDFSQVTITDDARIQAATVGLVSPTISFVAPTDLAFVESSFVSSSSNILVLEKPLAAYTCKKIDYKITFTTWAQNLNCFSEFVNTATVTKALTTMGKNLANNQTAQTKVILSASNLGGYGTARLEKKFGPGRINAFNNTMTSKVSVTVCNTGATPITLTSLIDDVQTALGSSAFSQPGVPVAYWICGSGILPTLNNAYDGKTQTNLLSGVFSLSAGQCFAIDFDLEFQKSILSTLTASSPFTNIASLNFTDIFGQTMECTARDTFYCDKCPQLSVEKSVDYIRFKKERINLFEGDIIKTKTQYEIAYEVSLVFKIMNTGCTTLSNVIPYVNIEDYMTANGVVSNQRGIVLHQKVSILNKFPGLGPNITANASFTGTQNATNSFPNQVIVESNLSLLPGQGFEFSIKYDYIPSNNSRKGVINVPPPSCSDRNISGSTPALYGNALIYTQYESVCQNGLQSQTFFLPLESHDCPNITLEKETVQLMDLSDRFTHTTDVYFQINAFETPLNQSPTFVAGPTYLPNISPETTTVPPPPTYNCYQATFKYKVTNSGNVPLDEIRICDNFFDQLIEDFNGGGESPFCGYYVVCPPPILVAGPQSGDDGIGSFSGNSSWSGLDSGDSYLGGGNAMLLPGTSIEFSAIVRFCINPKITIRLRNDAAVLARGPNESFVQGNSRGFISIIGPSLCFTKSWAPGYPLQIPGQDGYFTGQLLYTVYNDGDRRVLDVEVIDKFTDGVFTITSVDATETAPTPTRARVMSCDVVSGESLVNPAWNGLDTTNAVNHPPLPYLDRSELFTVSSPTFTFKVNRIDPLAVNTATVNGQVIYDNPALNNNKKLPELSAIVVPVILKSIALFS